MPGPVLWGPNNTSNNLQNQILNPAGALLSYNGPKNYINNATFENQLTSGWSLGVTGALTNGIPTGSPTFGSGASGNLSIATVTSGQLAGLASLSYVSSAATTAGNMLATDALTIDIEDQAKVLTWKFYYEAQTNPSNANWSGTSSNSFGVAVYDVTNSSWLTSAGNFGMTQSSGVGIATGTCQTNATTTQIRFVVYNANATSGAVTVYFDDFSIGPLTAPIGAPITSWQSYTPTIIGFGTPSAVSFWSRRVGDSLEVSGTFTSGTSTSTTASISLGFNGGNSNATIDSTKLTNGQLVGDAALGVSTANKFTVLGVTSSATVQLGLGSSGASSLTSALGNALAATGQVMNVYFKVPISGWSSNVQMSNDTNTQVITLIANGTPASASANGIVIYPTVSKDTSGSYNASTGEFTAPISGYYQVQAFINASFATNGTMSAYVGGSIQVPAMGQIPSALGFGGGSTTVFANAGQTIDVRNTAATGTVVSGLNGISITKVTGPSVIAATESVNARYFASATTISGSLATVVWTTKDFDSNNAMASGVYTIPVSGKYQANAALAVSGTVALNSTLDLQIQKNGAAVSEQNVFAGGIETGLVGDISDIINCNAGDTIRLQVSTSITGPSIVSSNTKNYFSISRVGN